MTHHASSGGQALRLWCRRAPGQPGTDGRVLTSCSSLQISYHAPKSHASWWSHVLPLSWALHSEPCRKAPPAGQQAAFALQAAFPCTSRASPVPWELIASAMLLANRRWALPHFVARGTAPGDRGWEGLPHTCPVLLTHLETLVLKATLPWASFSEALLSEQSSNVKLLPSGLV